jgi:hypothetical protein
LRKSYIKIYWCLLYTLLKTDLVDALSRPIYRMLLKVTVQMDLYE